MTKVSQRLWIILLAMTGFALVQACATAPKLPEPRPGLYVNEEYRFSVEYPEHWTSEPSQTGEIFRAANTNPYKLPVITVNVSDLQEDAILDPKGFTEGVKQLIPGTKRFKIYDQEDVTLNDGTPAKAFTYTWTWTDGVTKLLTAALITIKDVDIQSGEKQNKYFNTTATTVVGGDTPPEQLLEMVKSWKFY